MGTIGTWWRSRALHSPDAEERIRAVQSLAATSDPEAVKPLLEGLTDEDPYVRAKAAEALGELGDKEAIGPLVSLLLAEAEHFVGHAAVDALEKLDGPTALKLLNGALDDPDPSVSHNAAAGLRRIGWESLNKSQRAKVAVIQQAWQEATTYGVAAIEHLEGVIRLDEDSQVRREAAEALGHVDAPEATSALMGVLTDTQLETSHREAVIHALRSYCYEKLSATDRAYVAVAEGDWAAVVQLSQAAVGPLSAALADQRVTVAVEAAQALGEIGGVEAAGVLVAALGDAERDVGVREATATALGRLGDITNSSALVTALRDEGWNVREAAADALLALKWAPTKDDDRARLTVVRAYWEEAITLGDAAIEPLVDALRYCEVGQTAARVLGQIRPNGFKALVEVLRRPDQPLSVKEVVAATLAELGDPQAIEPIVAMLDDPDMIVRQAAVWTLERLGWEPHDDPQRALVAVAHEDWDELASLGPAAVEPLMMLAVNSLAPEETVETLSQLLTQSAARLSVDQLQGIAGLRDMQTRAALAPAQGDAGADQSQPHPGPTVVECSPVRQLARHELSRRGIKL